MNYSANRKLGYCNGSFCKPSLCIVNWWRSCGWCRHLTTLSIRWWSSCLSLVVPGPTGGNFSFLFISFDGCAVALQRFHATEIVQKLQFLNGHLVEVAVPGQELAENSLQISVKLVDFPCVKATIAVASLPFSLTSLLRLNWTGIFVGFFKFYFWFGGHF